MAEAPLVDSNDPPPPRQAVHFALMEQIKELQEERNSLERENQRLKSEKFQMANENRKLDRALFHLIHALPLTKEEEDN